MWGAEWLLLLCGVGWDWVEWLFGCGAICCGRCVFTILSALVKWAFACEPTMMRTRACRRQMPAGSFVFAAETGDGVPIVHGSCGSTA